MRLQPIFLGMVVVISSVTSLMAAEEDAILEQARKNHAKTAETLDKALEKAKQVHTEGKTKADALLSAAVDLAIQRATKRGDLAAANKLLKEKEAMQAGLAVAGEPEKPGPAAPAVPVAIKDLDNRKAYVCMLGIYGRHFADKPHPVVNLTAPDKNLWTTELQDKLRGKISFENINYKGTAKFFIAEDGAYTLNADRADIGIDGKITGAGDLQLKKGVHTITITSGTYGRSDMPGTTVRLVKKGEADPLPFFNTGLEIKQFLSQKVDNLLVAEVSGWTPVEAKVK